MAENICTVMETMEKDSTAAAVTALVRYGVSRGLITGDDAVFAANSIFDLMQMDPSGEYMPLEEGAPEEVFGNTQNERTKQFLQRYNEN